MCMLMRISGGGSVPKLTALDVKRADVKEPGKTRFMGDGGGLWLQVRSAEAKSWIFRYRYAGKADNMGLGPVRLISLAMARDMAIDAARLVRVGIDPKSHRDEAKAAAVGAGMTFRKAAEAYIAEKVTGKLSAKHAAQWPSTMETYVYPLIGSKNVAAITAADVKRVLMRDDLWETKAETAGRVRGRIEAVLDNATAHKWRKGDNPARWKGSMKHLLPAQSAAATVEHHPALPWKDVASFLVTLRAQRGVPARALEFTILTAARSGETFGATWVEMDLAGKLWTVPAERMKMKREHRVPLSDAAVALLRALLPLRDRELGDYVFPGGKVGKPLSNMAMTATLRRMDRGDITAHGFRSTFRDWCSDATDTPREVAEAALAHAVGDKVEAAYRRSDALTKRAALMTQWAAFCASSAAPAAAEVADKE